MMDGRNACQESQSHWLSVRAFALAAFCEALSVMPARPCLFCEVGVFADLGTSGRGGDEHVSLGGC